MCCYLALVERLLTNEEYWNISLKAYVSLSLIGGEKSSRVKMTYFHCFLQTIDGVLTDMGRLWSDLGLRKILPGTLWRNWGGRILEIESTPFVHSGVGSPIGCSTPWSSQTATRWCAMRCRYLTNEMVSFICISSSFVYHQANIRTFFMTDYKESKLSTSTSLFFVSFP